MFLRLGIIILTFVIGICGVYLFKSIRMTFELLELDISINSPIFKKLEKPRNSIKIPSLIDNTFDEIELNERFTLLGHACGNGYVSSYIVDDGQRLIEGSNDLTRTEFNKILREAVSVIRIEKNAKNQQEKIGTRIELIVQNPETGKLYGEIIWYDGKQNFQYIHAPTLEIALEFEEWDKSKK